MYTLRLLGGFALLGPDLVRALRLAPRAEAVLVLLALGGQLGCMRHRLLGLLWPDAEETHARHSLRDALHAIRHALGLEAVLASGDTLQLNPAVVTSDLTRFTGSVRAGLLDEAVHEYGGPLLEGFHLDGAPDFEHCVDRERTRLAREYADALERLAVEAETRGRPCEAASWWARAVEHDPYNTRLVIRRMWALEAVGDRANALQEAEAHARRLRTELEIDPDPVLAAELAALRDGRPSATAPPAAASSGYPS